MVQHHLQTHNFCMFKLENCFHQVLAMKILTLAMCFNLLTFHHKPSLGQTVNYGLLTNYLQNIQSTLVVLCVYQQMLVNLRR